MNIKDAVSMAFNGRPQPIEAIDCPKHKKTKHFLSFRDTWIYQNMNPR